MYTRYFGFNEKPFTLTPNPRFIFLSRNHKEAFAHLLYGINNRYGFIALTGEVGTGKTTVLRALLGQLHDDAFRTALIFSPCLTGLELLRSINSEFGLESESHYANELLATLNRFLLAETAAGRTVVLVIDESQNLQPDVLEQIRLISNLETENDKLIQIILAGQPELESLLARPDLRQLDQRIAVRYKLRSMSLDETRSYIRQRMEVAGETGGVSFSRSATAWIYFFTRGVPRMINILCDRALLIAYGDEKRRISATIVIRALRELLKRPQGRKTSLAAAAVIGTLVAIIGVVSMISQEQLPAGLRAAKQSVPSAVMAIPAPTGGPRQLSQEPGTTSAAETVAREIRSYDQNDTHVLVFNAIAEQWGIRPIKIFTEGLDIPDMFRRIAARRGLRLTLFRGNIDDIIRLDLPFIVSTTVTGDLGTYCYAITSAQGGQLSIAPPLFDRPSISRKDLASVATNTFYIAWKTPSHIPDTLSRGEQRGEVKELQRLLKNTGSYGGDIDGIYGSSTVEAVNRFQQAVGIASNDSVGELTLAALSRYDQNRKVPSLSGGRQE